MDEVEYLTTRAERELSLAQAAELHPVALAHYRMANAYLEQAEAIRAAPANDQDAAPRAAV